MKAEETEARTQSQPLLPTRPEPRSRKAAGGSSHHPQAAAARAGEGRFTMEARPHLLQEQAPVPGFEAP